MSDQPKPFRQVRSDLANVMADDALPCAYCGTATSRKTLSALGARCHPCYEQFLRLGYSGQEPPKQFAQSPEVRADQARIAAYREGRPALPNAFAALSERLKARQAEREVAKGLDDDAVNAMLQAEAS